MTKAVKAAEIVHFSHNRKKTAGEVPAVHYVI
jgi:hypothetical protein